MPSADAQTEKVRAAFMRAIDFTLKTTEGLTFLELWCHGQFDQIDQDWPEFDTRPDRKDLQEAKHAYR